MTKSISKTNKIIHLPSVQFVEVRVELNVGAAVGHFVTSGINLKGYMFVVEVLLQHKLSHAISPRMEKKESLCPGLCLRTPFECLDF